MANPYSIEPANPLQALMMGVQGYDRSKKIAAEDEMKVGRAEAVQALQSGGDIRSALAKLIGIGDVKGAEAIATFAKNQSDAEHQKASLAETSRYHTGSLANQAANTAETSRYHSGSLAQQGAQLAHTREVANRAEVKTIKDDNGNEILVRIDRNGTPTQLAVPGQKVERQNPFLTGGAMNESQSKDALYANRMMNAERAFQEKGVIDAAQNPLQIGLNSLPGAGSYLSSTNYQKYDQAKRDFINATLRRESGAVISPEEFKNADKQYFPQVGNDPAVLAQKKRNRIEAIKGIGAGAGKGYNPEYTVGADGSVVPRSAGGQQAAPSMPAPPPGFQLVK